MVHGHSDHQTESPEEFKDRIIDMFRKEARIDRG